MKNTNRIYLPPTRRETRFKIIFWSSLCGALSFATGYWYAMSSAADLVREHLAK